MAVENGITMLIGMVILAAIIGFPLLGLYADFQTSEGTITVTEKIGAHGEEGQYLIVAEDDQVYTVADNWVYLKFDASDRYAGLKVGKKYHVKFTGFRNHPLSWYKNIIEYQVEKEVAL